MSGQFNPGTIGPSHDLSLSRIWQTLNTRHTIQLHSVDSVQLQ
ncbi:10811_t:CDS:2 [Acaulospora colombiana]|uniref:10811_t:CDS:1 n=1 Tax=Acaulospora colombiana TaxID=27376 RepID=A0ACA9K6S7_9GLOM|nr:10811_t:CDS:2 [Acaulospora colombiana]